MGRPIEERDWRYLWSIRDEMLHALCSRIKNEAAGIATGEGKTPHEQYLKLYRYIEEADGVIADCFNDWRRSNISVKILFLRRHGLLHDEHIQNFSDSTQEWLSKADEPEHV